ncbi:MAG: hypothetical protein M3N82_00905 [Pseudomonadota bacterium]|nr:hypothetical protein [Pseudomonadota bacterium]
MDRAIDALMGVNSRSLAGERAPSALWNDADLEIRLCRALDLARTTVSSFAEEGHVDSETPILSFGPEKPIAETAMLLYAASACRERPEVGRRLRELAEFLIPHARSRRVLVDMALHPALCFKFAVPHILLTRLGYFDSDFDHHLARCAASSLAHGHERPPSAFFERHWISSLWTGGDIGAPRQQRASGSVLECPLDILGGLREDAYAFTHLLFYSTDFGFKPPRLPRSAASILAQAGSMLARYMDAEDYDLSAEVLLTWPLLAAPWNATAAFCFRVLAAVEDQAGLLPCGNMDLSRLSRLQGQEQARYALGTSYHTAYVMGLLCASALRPDRAPPVRIPGRRFPASLLHELLFHVSKEQGHWRAEFALRGRAEQRALVPFILDIAIVQASRRRDFQALGDILSLAGRNGISSTPLCRQATELLQRVASCAVAVSSR